MTELLQAIVSGLLVGLTYALLGVGFSLTWGAVGVINISHSAFAVLAAYIGYFAFSLYSLDPLVALLAIVPVFFLIGVLLDKTLFKIILKKSRHIGFSSMVLTFGIAVVLENVMMWVFTANPRVLKADYNSISYNIGSVHMSGGQLISALLSLVSLFIIFWFLYHTYTGKAVRAFEQEPDGAALTGVNTNKVTSITTGVAISSAGVAGVALSMLFPFEATVHMDWIISIFLVVILGGVGNVAGTLIGGLAIGMIITVSGVWVPYSLVNLVMFMILILILIFRTKETLA
jgi:branched-chain amino acid transport system permease protein